MLEIFIKMFGSQVIKERLDITKMNLQCRSHTSMKVNFFKNEKHLQTINRQFINYSEESFEDLYNLADMLDIIKNKVIRGKPRLNNLKNC